MTRLQQDKTITRVLVITGVLFVLGFLVASMFAVYDAALGRPTPTPVVQTRTPVASDPATNSPATAQEPPPATAPATKYATVEDYFSDGNPNPLSHSVRVNLQTGG